MTDLGGEPGDPLVRVISIYATAWRHKQAAAGDTVQAPDLALANVLPLGERLEEFHYLFSEQLPRVLKRRLIDPGRLDLTGGLGGQAATVSSCQLWLFFLPSDQLVAALDFHVESLPLTVDPGLAISILERMAVADFTVDGKHLGELIAELAEECGAQLVEEPPARRAPKQRRARLLPLRRRDVRAPGPAAPPRNRRVEVPPERHQVVFVPRLPEGRLSTVAAARILYRIEPPFRPEFVDVAEPAGLNPPDQPKQGLVTAYTSLLVGHDENIENSVFLTAVQAVGTAARFRQIWHRAHALVRDFRYRYQEEDRGQQSRASMEYLADDMGNLELELSFSVETSADIGLLIPTLRSHTFHKELHNAMELEERAERVSRMFQRLDSSIRSELTAIDIRQGRKRDTRRIRWAIAINVLSILVVSITIALGYFGLDHDSRAGGPDSLFGPRYRPVYWFSALIAVLPLAVWLLVSLPLWSFELWTRLRRRTTAAAGAS